MRVAALLLREKYRSAQPNISPSEIPPALVFNRPLVKLLRASDLHAAAETSISGFSNRKLMFHAQFSGITGELYAAGQIRLMSAGEIFLTATI